MCLVAQWCPTLCDPVDCSLPGSSSVHEDSPGKNTGVGCHALLQGIFLTQGLPLCGQILYHLSHQGSPRMLEWVAYPFPSFSFLTQELNRGLQADSLAVELPGSNSDVSGFKAPNCSPIAHSLTCPAPQFHSSHPELAPSRAVPHTCFTVISLALITERRTENKVRKSSTQRIPTTHQDTDSWFTCTFFFFSYLLPKLYNPSLRLLHETIAKGL